MMEEKKEMKAFKEACLEYLKTLNLENLRSYGRFLQLKNLINKNKEGLIQEIIGVLCGELAPEKIKQDAPAENPYLDANIIKTVESLQKQYGVAK